METSAYMQERYREYIKAFRLFDDDFLKEVFDNNHEATELVLNIILDRTDLKVQKVVGQREIKGIEGHSVRLDILAEDSEGKVYDIEIQRSDRGNLPLRAREGLIHSCRVLGKRFCVLILPKNCGNTLCIANIFG